MAHEDKGRPVTVRRRPIGENVIPEAAITAHDDSLHSLSAPLSFTLRSPDDGEWKSANMQALDRWNKVVRPLAGNSNFKKISSKKDVTSKTSYTFCAFFQAICQGSDSSRMGDVLDGAYETGSRSHLLRQPHTNTYTPPPCLSGCRIQLWRWRSRFSAVPSLVHSMISTPHRHATVGCSFRVAKSCSSSASLSFNFSVDYNVLKA